MKDNYQEGHIVKLVAVKGIGFVQGRDGTERFFHRSVVRGNRFALLREGQVVTFVAEDDAPKGPRCSEVVQGDGRTVADIEANGNR